jgi:hypothetical protein
VSDARQDRTPPNEGLESDASKACVPRASCESDGVGRRAAR